MAKRTGQTSGKDQTQNQNQGRRKTKQNTVEIPVQTTVTTPFQNLANTVDARQVATVTTAVMTALGEKHVEVGTKEGESILYPWEEAAKALLNRYEHLFKTIQTVAYLVRAEKKKQPLVSNVQAIIANDIAAAQEVLADLSGEHYKLIRDTVATAVTTLYFDTLKFFQEVGLIDKNATYVLYIATKRGKTVTGKKRVEIPLSQINEKKVKQYGTLGFYTDKVTNITKSSFKVCFGKVTTNINNYLAENKVTYDIYGRLLTNMQVVQRAMAQDENIFENLIVQLFPTQRQENSKTSVLKNQDENQSSQLNSSEGALRTFNRGQIVEAFEIHYQSIYSQQVSVTLEDGPEIQVSQLYQNPKEVDHDEGSIKTLQSANNVLDQIQHYISHIYDRQKIKEEARKNPIGGLYLLMKEASGQTPGYVMMDQGFAQVKGIGATLINSLSSFQNMKDIVNIFCSKDLKEIEESLTTTLSKIMHVTGDEAVKPSIDELERKALEEIERKLKL